MPPLYFMVDPPGYGSTYRNSVAASSSLQPTISGCENVAVKIFGMECIFGLDWTVDRVRPWILDTIAVPVPALVSAETFAMAQERLIENKRLSARRTKIPTLLQGLLICGQCGYGLYRTSTKTSKRQVQYYRCLGSDRYRHLRGPACQCRPIRQDYLDELVWEEVVQLLNEPELVRAEIERRIQESQSSDPVQQRKLRLERELKRIASQLDKLLDAYQEDLIGLGDLRSRAPELRRRQAAIEKELEGVALQALEKSRLTQLNASMENFLAALRQSAKNLEVVERQKVVRLVIKQIVVEGGTLTIHHSIPISRSNEGQPRASYALCTRRTFAVAG
jgi:site-specific DNA recombinase